MNHASFSLCMVIVALTASGCSGVQILPTVATVTRLGTTVRPPIDEKLIVVYLKETDIPAPFERLGLIHTSGNWMLVGPADLIARAKEEASKLGANAILLGELQEPTKSAKAADVLVPIVIPPDGVKRRQEVVAIYVQQLDKAKGPNQQK